jgi:acetolactate decarboxylase
MENRTLLIILFIILYTGNLLAQSTHKAKAMANKQAAFNQSRIGKPQLYQYGVANSFIDGLYEGELTIKQLKQQGDFGIGAPNLIDGELTIVNGKAYQSNAKGHTIEAPESLRTPFAFVTNFRPDTVLQLTDITDLKDLFARIEKLIPNPNVIYALRLKGLFSSISTRAFPPVLKEPYKPLVQLLDQQQFFELKATEGDMIGFYMPGYLTGLNIVGLHFHFLSKDRQAGGHVVAVQAKLLALEIAEIKEYHLVPPDTDNFRKQRSAGDNSTGLQKIEKGNR